MRSSPGAGHVCISLKVDLCSHNVTWFVVMWSLMKSSVLVCDHHYIFHVCEWERACNFFPVCFSQRHGWPFCLQTPVFTCFQSQPTSKFSVDLIPLLSDTHHLCHLTPSRLHLIMQACIFPLIYCACNRKYGQMPLLRLFFFNCCVPVGKVFKLYMQKIHLANVIIFDLFILCMHACATNWVVRVGSVTWYISRGWIWVGVHRVYES